MIMPRLNTSALLLYCWLRDTSGAWQEDAAVGTCWGGGVQRRHAAAVCSGSSRPHSRTMYPNEPVLPVRQRLASAAL